MYDFVISMCNKYNIMNNVTSVPSSGMAALSKCAQNAIDAPRRVSFVQLIRPRFLI